MGAKVINLSDYRKSKEKERAHEQAKDMLLKDEFKRSLDNESVKRKYKVKTLTVEEQRAKIAERIERINDLMRQLENSTKRGKDEDGGD